MKDKPLKYFSVNDVVCSKVNSKYIDYLEKEIERLRVNVQGIDIDTHDMLIHEYEEKIKEFQSKYAHLEKCYNLVLDESCEHEETIEKLRQALEEIAQHSFESPQGIELYSKSAMVAREALKEINEI